MSTRTDWGIFDAAGSPLAVGDEHHKWECPDQKWDYNNGYEHCITGEWVEEPPCKINCPWKSVDAKLDRCTKCGNQFKYP